MVAVGLVVGSVAVAGATYAVVTGGSGSTRVAVGSGSSVTGPPSVEPLLSPSTLPASSAARPAIAGQFGDIPSCPPSASTGTTPTTIVHLDLSGYPGRLAQHCYYASPGAVDIIFRDGVVNPATGLVVPEAFQLSSTDAPAVGGSAAIGWIYDTAAGVGISPTAITPDPIDVRVPVLAAGTFYIGLVTESMAGPAVLTVGG